MKPAPALCVAPDCPAPRHDTASGYRHGCRSGAARAATARESKARRVGVHEPRCVDNTSVVRRLQGLAVMGWSSTELGRRLGVTNNAVNLLRSGRYAANRSSVDKIVALYDELAMIPGGDTRTAREATRKGWVAPLAWADEEIDDPAATPVTDAPADLDGDPAVVEAVVRGRVTWGQLTSADKHLLARELRRRGYSCSALAAAVGASHDTVRHYFDQARPAS